MIGASLLLRAPGLDGRSAAPKASPCCSLGIAYTCAPDPRGPAGERARVGESRSRAGTAAGGGRCSLIGVRARLLVLGSRWLVDGAAAFARALGVSELVIGLTIVAAGTSLPEVATSVMAALRGRARHRGRQRGRQQHLQHPGGPGPVRTWPPDRASTCPPAALRFDLPVMMAVAVACLPIFFTGHVIARWEGGLFLGYYVAYAGLLVLAATQSPALRVFRAAMAGFVLPLTVVTLVLILVRSTPFFTRAGR